MMGGMYVLLRKEGLDRAAALFGGLVTALSGFAMLHWMHTAAVGIMAHTPWLLMMMRGLVGKPSRTYTALAVAGISVFTASQLLLGHPQFVYFSCVAEGLYILFAARWNQWPRLLALIGAAKALGILMAGVQLVPTWDGLTHSVRAVPDVAFRTSYSLPPYMLLQLLGPNLFNRGAQRDNAHEFGLYCGTATVLLVIWALVRYRRLGPKRMWAFVLAALGIVLALGKYGGLYSLLSYLPLLNKFRGPARHIAVVHLAFGVLAAWAFADLARVRLSRIKSNSSQRALGAVAIAVIVAWLIPLVVMVLSAKEGPWTPWISAIPFSMPTRMFVGPVLATMAGVLIFAAVRGHRYALPLLILFAAADQGWFGLRYVHFGPMLDPMKLVEGFAKPAGPGRTTSTWEEDPFIMMLTMADYPTNVGYVALTPRRQLDYSNPMARRIAGIRWLATSRPDLWLQPDPNTPNRPLWQDLGPPLPRVRLVGSAEVCADPSTRLDQIDPEQVALVSEPLALDGGAPGTAEITTDRPGNISIQINAPGCQLLVLSESYHEGWQARIDGLRAHIVPVYGDWIGCPVPSGRHEVQLIFQPNSMKWGLRTTIAGAVGTFLLALLLRFAPCRSCENGQVRKRLIH
jgi:hypothetical protein